MTVTDHAVRLDGLGRINLPKKSADQMDGGQLADNGTNLLTSAAAGHCTQTQEAQTEQQGCAGLGG